MNNQAKLSRTSRYCCLEYRQRQSDDLYLILCGWEHCEPQKSFGPAIRSGYHLHAILYGKGFLETPSGLMHLHAGQLFVTKENENTYYYADPEDPWTYCWIAFGGNNAQYYIESAGFREGINFLDCYVDPQQFNRLVHELIDHPELNLPNDLRRTGLLYEYIALAIESYYKSTNTARTRSDYTPEMYVDYAIDFIRRNYANIRVGDIARYIGINRSYLTDIFKKKTGVSPQEYLINFRLNESRLLLRTTALPIQEVAAKVGYDNPLTFSKMFKNAYQMSPRAYRAQQPNGAEEAEES